LDTASSLTPVQQQETIVKRVIGAALILGMAGGCTSGTSTARPAAAALLPAPLEQPVLVADVGSDAAVAHVGGKAISRAEFEKNLTEAYGLKILLYQVSLSLAKQKADEQHIQYAQADIDAEFQRTLKQAFGNAPRKTTPPSSTSSSSARASAASSSTWSSRPTPSSARSPSPRSKPR
jgi:hypothetical protein